jgi:hypothetical protein
VSAPGDTLPMRASSARSSWPVPLFNRSATCVY